MRIPRIMIIFVTILVIISVICVILGTVINAKSYDIFHHAFNCILGAIVLLIANRLDRQDREKG